MNTAAGVVIEVEGPPANVAAFAAAVVDRAPPLAVIDDVADADVACTGAATFEIRASEGGAAATLVSPDVATCEDCRRELADPDRPPVPVPVHELHELRARGTRS